MIINLTNKGMNADSGFYIGRGSIYGNSYLTKPSKYPGKIYKLDESLALYERDLIEGKIDISDLIQHIFSWDIINLNCFCINRRLTEESTYSNIKCHGEIIAKHIFERLKKLREE